MAHRIVETVQTTPLAPSGELAQGGFGLLERVFNGVVQCGNALYEEWQFSDGFGIRADLVEHVLVGRLCQCGSGELAGACNQFAFFCG